MSGQGVVERASAELSRRINSLSFRSKHRSSSKNSPSRGKSPASAVEAGKFLPAMRSPPPPLPSSSSSSLVKIPAPDRSKARAMMRRQRFKDKPATLEELTTDEEFLEKLFAAVPSSSDKKVLAMVCGKWRDVLYRSPKHWKGTTLVVRWKELRPCNRHEKTRFFASIPKRGMCSLTMLDIKDEDVDDVVHTFPLGQKCITSLSLKWTCITDKRAEQLVNHFQALTELELCGCNELTEGALWSYLPAGRLTSFKVADCIHMSDEAVGAVAQLLPSLVEFHFQAYHVTDAAMGFFTPRQSATLTILRLQSCWEITNQAILNIVHGLPNLTELSLSGCMRVGDDGIEILSDRMKKLKILDISWLPKISDFALEYISCDLTALQQLTVDRCSNITDLGLGYLSTMPCLQILYMRYCQLVRDAGISHLSAAPSLKVLSVAGCASLSKGGLCALSRMKQLEELELTNCAAATNEVTAFLTDHLPKCNVLN